MTQEALERGERLTINNANKAQLKWMVRDRDAEIERLNQRIVQLRKEADIYLEQTQKVLEAWQDYLRMHVEPVEVKKGDKANEQGKNGRRNFCGDR